MWGFKINRWPKMLKKTVFKKRGKMFGWKGSISYSGRITIVRKV